VHEIPEQSDERDEEEEATHTECALMRALVAIQIEQVLEQ